MGYARQALIGVSWMGALRGMLRLITFVRIIVLAKLLSPSQFGIFAIITIILSLFEVLTETGINIFLVQEKQDIRRYINSAWVISIARGTLLMLLMLLVSPFVSAFFNIEQLLPLLFLASLIPLVRGFINPSVASFQKELFFNKEFYFKSVLAVVEAGIAIILTFITRDVASLVWAMLASAVLEVGLSFWLIKPRPSFSFEMSNFRLIIGRGKWVTLSGIFQYLAQEGDNFVVGKILGSYSLGLYQVAYKISTLPISEITDVINRVAFPVYVKIESDVRRLFTAYVKTSFFIVGGSLVMAIVIFLYSNQIVMLLLGEKWFEAIPVLKVLAVYGALRAIVGSPSALFLAARHQGFIAGMTFVRLCGLIITIIPLTLHYGIIGASYSAVISVLVEAPIVVIFLIKIFNRRNIIARELLS